MKNQMQSFFSITLSVATLFAFVACGKSSDGGDTTASAGGGTTSVESTVNAQCNGFDASANWGIRLGGRIATFYDGSNFVEDKVRVRLTTVTTAFDSPGSTIQFFRWNANSAGAVSLDSTPLSFTIYYGTQAISSAMTSLDSAAVTALRNQIGVGTTSSDFFNRTSIVVSGVDNGWQVLKTVLYNGTDAIADADALMPLFVANPNTYAASHPAVLNGLHPFYANRSNGSTDAQWVQLSNQNCFY